MEEEEEEENTEEEEEEECKEDYVGNRKSVEGVNV